MSVLPEGFLWSLPAPGRKGNASHNRNGKEDPNSTLDSTEGSPFWQGISSKTRFLHESTVHIPPPFRARGKIPHLDQETRKRAVESAQRRRRTKESKVECPHCRLFFPPKDAPVVHNCPAKPQLKTCRFQDAASGKSVAFTLKTTFENDHSKRMYARDAAVNMRVGLGHPGFRALKERLAYGKRMRLRAEIGKARFRCKRCKNEFDEKMLAMTHVSTCSRSSTKGRKVKATLEDLTLSKSEVASTFQSVMLTQYGGKMEVPLEELKRNYKLPAVAWCEMPEGDTIPELEQALKDALKRPKLVMRRSQPAPPSPPPAVEEPPDAPPEQQGPPPVAEVAEPKLDQVSEQREARDLLPTPPRSPENMPVLVPAVIPPTPIRIPCYVSPMEKENPERSNSPEELEDGELNSTADESIIDSPVPYFPSVSFSEDELEFNPGKTSSPVRTTNTHDGDVLNRSLCTIDIVPHIPVGDRERLKEAEPKNMFMFGQMPAATPKKAASSPLPSESLDSSDRILTPLEASFTDTETNSSQRETDGLISEVIRRLDQSVENERPCAFVMKTPPTPRTPSPSPHWSSSDFEAENDSEGKRSQPIPASPVFKKKVSSSVLKKKASSPVFKKASPVFKRGSPARRKNPFKKIFKSFRAKSLQKMSRKSTNSETTEKGAAHRIAKSKGHVTIARAKQRCGKERWSLQP